MFHDQIEFFKTNCNYSKTDRTDSDGNRSKHLGIRSNIAKQGGFCK